MSTRPHQEMRYPKVTWRIILHDYLHNYVHRGYQPAPSKKTSLLCFALLCPPGTNVHCDYTVHVSADLSLWLDSPMFGTSWHQSMSIYSQPSFSSSTWKMWAMDKCKLGVISQERLKIEVKLLSIANKKYMPRRLAQQRMTLSDRE